MSIGYVNRQRLSATDSIQPKSIYSALMKSGTSDLCHSLLPDCYVILVVVAINQFIAIEPDERPKVSVEETIAFDRDQRDGETCAG